VTSTPGADQRCPTCLATDPGQCRCGSAWAEPEPGEFGLLTRVEMDHADWEWQQFLLVMRSSWKGQPRCEARTPACLTFDGVLTGLPRYRISIHHRRGRKMGGTARPDTNLLSNLLLVCGHGTIGCHWWIGQNARAAAERGLIVREGEDPAKVEVELASGARVLLDPTSQFYIPVPPDLSRAG
jgi:hypothetical protein